MAVRRLLSSTQVTALNDVLSLNRPLAQIIGWLRSQDFDVSTAAGVHELRARSINALNEAKVS